MQILIVDAAIKLDKTRLKLKNHNLKLMKKCAPYILILRYDNYRAQRCFGLLLLFMSFALQLMAQQSVPVTSRINKDYPYIWFVEKRDSIRLTDEDFFNSCAKVVFPVNKFDLPKNDKILNELDQIVLPRVNQDSLSLVGIVIRGAASPEGPYSFNKMLSEKRGKALSDFVKQRISFSDFRNATIKRLSEDYVTEDYRSLCIAMKQAGDPNYNYVKDLCDYYLGKNDEKRLKQALMKVQQGRLWKHLLKTYFPELRAARFMLFFRQLPQVTLDPQILRETILPPMQQPELPVPMLSALPREEFLLRKKMLSVKTNLLLYGAYIPGYDRWAPIPNVAIEYYPLGGHFTFGASFDMPWWQDYNAHKYFQFRNYQVEARWYARGAKKSDPARIYNKKAYTGFYLQGYAHLAVFGICFDENRGWVGEGAGAGVGAGYVLPISKSGRWKLEVGAQLGFFRCKYDPYQFENPVNLAYRDGLYYYKWTQKPELFKKRQYRWNWIGPTRIGVTLIYDLLYRRIQKKGVSLKSTERRVEQ